MHPSTQTMEETGNQHKHEQEEEEIVCLDASFFVNDNYQLTKFTFGSQEMQLFCLNSASTDFDLTGQLVWPGAMLMNDYLSKNMNMLQGCSVIELGSGVGITGILCSRFCHKVVMTDHNEEVLKILKKNIELHSCPENISSTFHGLVAEKLEWGNKVWIGGEIEEFILLFNESLGENYTLTLKQKNIFNTWPSAEHILNISGARPCLFITQYYSIQLVMELLLLVEVESEGVSIDEILQLDKVVSSALGKVNRDLSLLGVRKGSGVSKESPSGRLVFPDRNTFKRVSLKSLTTSSINPHTYYSINL
ncbi:hypothetical protein Fmac_018388 [Flemingia macrophylla]|uniref:Uncharacterized protein n=1 Tax=Flemingia macrophylla TaxID=520843 RepID=A0ABD1M4U9_9FABA